MKQSSTAFRAADVLDTVATELARKGPEDRLLRRAAAQLASACIQFLAERTGGVYGRRVALLVGTGKNGADALLACPRLRRRGVVVEALLVADTAYEPGVIALLNSGGRIITPMNPGDAAKALARADLVVDGIIGESSFGALRGRAAELVAAIPADMPVIAVDLPSGVDPDTGEISGPHVRADVTVTFSAAKPCVLLPPGCHAAGLVRLVDVGLPPLPAAPVVRRLGDSEIAALWPIPETAAHKYIRGVLGVVAGSDAYPGAAVLAVAGAVQSGAAGIIRFVGPGGVTAHVLSAIPEAVPGIGQVQAWLLGSGVENDEDQDNAIGVALDSGLPCVVDAGALEACVRRRNAGNRPTPSDRLLLTPHAGEMARIIGWLGTGVTRAEIEARPMHYGHEIAKALDATILVKGATTLIVRPDGFVASQAEAPAWLATAGAGDVLAGIAGALMAAGLNAFDAGEIAASVHGRAAAHAHQRRGGGPLTASSVAEAVPQVVGQLLAC
ncbi:bifunctional ADP-dependent NAD(P)H-hydrate dehydratase/NAD(P)H-hydrate epimerase [Nocardia amamiensis]|uniref:Bifunctional NAD(P)H-hydrate repair enzyme n=2 Tax=Nocardia amamiensis TaxID=404578 RepID=A0ABS0CQY3_9NOCA|nr:bifunctional ADP-dependent NAD(P)H-hydrate dehydratase/NAD(P)H-hydrate epimerase [Nocardia amamiensis]